MTGGMTGSFHSRAAFWRRVAMRCYLALFGVAVRALDTAADLPADRLLRH